MWIRFAPPAVQWLTFACFVVLVLAMLAMPKDERARMFRGARRRRTRQPFSSTADGPWTPLDAGNASASGTSHDLMPESSSSLRTLGAFASAARVAIAVSAVVMFGLLLWMAIAFVLSVPGWR